MQFKLTKFGILNLVRTVHILAKTQTPSFPIDPIFLHTTCFLQIDPETPYSGSLNVLFNDFPVAVAIVVFLSRTKITY